MKVEKWQSFPIAVLGGDKRQLVLVEELLKLGVVLYTAGLPGLRKGPSLFPCGSAVEAVAKAKVILLPMPGVDEEGRIRSPLSKKPLYFDEAVVQALPQKSLVVVGVANTYLKTMAARGQFKLVEINEDDELAILNSVPSAEGALQIAMEELPITIHGSESMVIGFGRLGKTMARMLGAMGAKVTVVARKPADLARVWEMGFRPLYYDGLEEVLPKTDIIFNTVPVTILDRTLLGKVKKTALIVDLASAPGGTDFDSAKEMGLQAFLAPGLPGKVAPHTAGILLAKVLPGIIARELPSAKL